MSFFTRPGPSPAPGTCDEIVLQCQELKMAETRGDLGERIALLVLRHSPADIQRMKRNFATKVRDLAPDYRDRLTRKITEHLLGTYQRIRLMHQQGIFRTMQEPVAEEQKKYWDMVAEQCRDDDGGDAPAIRFLKYLLAGFCMLVLDEPGHPPGTPFPGGDMVEFRMASATARSGRKPTMWMQPSARSAPPARPRRSGTSARRSTRASTGNRSSSTIVTVITTSTGDLRYRFSIFL